MASANSKFFSLKGNKNWHLLGGQSSESDAINSTLVSHKYSASSKLADEILKDERNLKQQNGTKDHQSASPACDLIENVLNISFTLVKVMELCGIDQRVANKTLDLIVYSFLNYQEVTFDTKGHRPRKRLKKEELYRNLREETGMSKSVAKLSYSIINNGFWAFYRRQGSLSEFDAELFRSEDWDEAIKRTIIVFANTRESQCETNVITRKIKDTYTNYFKGATDKQNHYPNLVDDYDTSTCQGCKGKAFEQKHGDGQICETTEDLRIKAECQSCVVAEKGTKLLCKDSKGRLFLTVDQNSVFYDPCVMKEKARKYLRKKRKKTKPCICRCVTKEGEKLGGTEGLENKKAESETSTINRSATTGSGKTSTLNDSASTAIHGRTEDVTSKDDMPSENEVSSKMNDMDSKYKASESSVLVSSLEKKTQKDEGSNAVENGESMKGNKDSDKKEGENAKDTSSVRSLGGHQSAHPKDLKCKFAISIFQSVDNENVIHLELIGCSCNDEKIFKTVDRVEVLTSGETFKMNCVKSGSPGSDVHSERDMREEEPIQEAVERSLGTQRSNKTKSGSEAKTSGTYTREEKLALQTVAVSLAAQGSTKTGSMSLRSEVETLEAQLDK